MNEDETNPKTETFARWLDSLPPVGQHTPECLPMPTLERMALDSTAGTAQERAHVGSCSFCGGLINRIRVRDRARQVEDDDEDEVGRENKKVAVARRGVFMLPGASGLLAAAACLAIGIGIGLAMPYHRYDSEAMKSAVGHGNAAALLMDRLKHGGAPGPSPSGLYLLPAPPWPEPDQEQVAEGEQLYKELMALLEDLDRLQR
jgi:hypothetical protein